MALLATFSNAGIVSMINGPATAAGTFCVAHGLSTTPDFAFFIPRALTSIPIALISRTTTTVIANTGTATVAIEAEMFAQVVHSIMR